MASLLKLLIIICSLVVFTYAASLALQGNLEMEVILKDIGTLKAYLATKFGN